MTTVSPKWKQWKKIRTFTGQCHLKLGVQPEGRFGNMHTSKFPGFCGNVNWMTVGCEDCGSFGVNGRWDVPSVGSAVMGKIWLCGKEIPGPAAAKQQKRISPIYSHPAPKLDRLFKWTQSQEQKCICVNNWISYYSVWMWGPGWFIPLRQVTSHAGFWGIVSCTTVGCRCSDFIRGWGASVALSWDVTCAFWGVGTSRPGTAKEP